MIDSDDINPKEAGSARGAGAAERDLCEEVEAYVATQPWRALTIALAVGFVIGRFIL